MKREKGILFLRFMNWKLSALLIAAVSFLLFIKGCWYEESGVIYWIAPEQATMVITPLFLAWQTQFVKIEEHIECICRMKVLEYVRRKVIYAAISALLFLLPVIIISILESILRSQIHYLMAFFPQIFVKWCFLFIIAILLYIGIHLLPRMAYAYIAVIAIVIIDYLIGFIAGGAGGKIFGALIYPLFGFPTTYALLLYAMMISLGSMLVYCFLVKNEKKESLL